MRYRIITIVVLIFAGLITAYFSTRNYLLTKILTKVKTEAKSSYNFDLSYKSAGFAGFKTVYISGLMLVSEHKDTIIKGDSILINPRLFPLLMGKKQLAELDFFRTDIKINKELIKLLQKRNAADSIHAKPANYAELINSLQNKIFTYIPKRLLFQNTGFKYQGDSVFATAYCNKFEYDGDSFQGDVMLTDNKIRQRCFAHGTLDLGKHKLNATISHTDTSLVKLPYLNAKWNALVGFDTLNFSVSFKKESDNLLKITGEGSARRLTIQHKRIGPDMVVTQNGGMQFNINVGERYAELDSSSVVRFNKFSFSPYLRFEKNKNKKVTIAFTRKEFDAQSLFESFPSGLFSNFDGIRTKGRLAYHMYLSVDLDNPDDIQFDSRLENKGFQILTYGVTDFRKMNGAFVHDVYENDRFVKSILVSPTNPDYVPIDEVSPYVKYSFLTSEDGDFFYHHGFNEKAFRESITKNLKAGRFVRGGSTISMQLVKNVFLSRKKTISRKIEEAMIVWMIENLHLVSKERMFEVYLNIMELGPGVYGLKPAARFYFNKLPANLTLAECIYLSSIIPHPKAFRYTFLSNGMMRDYMAGYYKLLSGIMLRRNQILPTDTINLKPQIKLTGEARKFLMKADSTARQDSLMILESKDLLPIDLK
ncbi:MAG: biosynthetic peptidoglycan transglycosylase [Bacteroidota bacterium]|nr:biosynthetic peptidoglycan transglycosylase [Bacteroidota bacterium]